MEFILLKVLSFNMASRGGVEPPTFPLGGGCSIQLSYRDETKYFTLPIAPSLAH